MRRTTSPRGAPTRPAREHDLLACPGCNAPLDMTDLVVLFHETLNTLYKWSRKGYPYFPKCRRKPNGRRLITCRDTHAWAREGQR